MLISFYIFPPEIRGPISEEHLPFPLLLTVVAIIVVLGMALTCGSLSIGKKHLFCISANLIWSYFCLFVQPRGVKLICYKGWILHKFHSVRQDHMCHKSVMPNIRNMNFMHRKTQLTREEVELSKSVLLHPMELHPITSFQGQRSCTSIS